jgi:hypothetical protein
VRRHPKLSTRLANLFGIAIAFNQEISAATRDFQSGLWQSNPSMALSNLTYAATGVNPSAGGQIVSGQTVASATSKVAGYAIAKVLKMFLRKFKV